MWLRVPELADRLQKVGGYIRYESGTDQKLIEFAICVTARAWNAAYEWHAHAPLAIAAGLNPLHLAALVRDEVPNDLDPSEAVVYRIATSLATDGAISDETFQTAASTLGETSLVEIILTCGYYTLVAFTLNVAQVPLPADAAPWTVPTGLAVIDGP
jgi:4-carboxymuconolactone decarboxylase